MSHKTHQEEANLPELKKAAALAATSIRINTVSLRSKRRDPEPVDDAAADGGVDVADTTKTATPVLKKKRCFGCAKRVGLTGFRCRCGELFCSVHRYSDRHDCSYDYKAAGREAIARENPVVRAAKILKV